MVRNGCSSPGARRSVAGVGGCLVALVLVSCQGAGKHPGADATPLGQLVLHQALPIGPGSLEADPVQGGRLIGRGPSILVTTRNAFKQSAPLGGPSEFLWYMPYCQFQVDSSSEGGLSVEPGRFSVVGVRRYQRTPEANTSEDQLTDYVTQFWLVSGDQPNVQALVCHNVGDQAGRFLDEAGIRSILGLVATLSPPEPK